MIPCKHCNTLNSLDSTFCKRCGTGIPEDELTEARAKLEDIVQEGVHALNLGKVDEAMAIADNAVASDPSSVTALSLKASCHERKGQIVEALECAEKVVELNPNSDLDKIKRNQLRNALMSSAQAERLPSRSMAVVAGVCVAILVICVPIAVARQMQKNAPPVVVATNSPAKTDLPMSTGQQETQAQTAQPQQPAQQVPAQDNKVQSPYDNLGDVLDYGAPEEPTRRTVRGDNTLPPGNQPSGGGGAELSPFDPKVSSTEIGDHQNSPAPSGSVAPRNGGGDPPPQVDGQTSQAAAVPPAPQGSIVINVHGPGNGRAGNRGVAGSDSDGGEGSSAYWKVGNQQFQIGNYSGAASSLEKALRSGGDPVQVAERLGQAYASLGRKSDAAGAYQRCIDACNASIAGGKGNVTRLRAVRDACQTALQQIQGG
ncbi:MAG TPA: tetratricopeptide repeat protein [Fimbriimonas sp.]|nr:tetratricopeptide repeat protein [Fimbriimonas sp.]